MPSFARSGQQGNEQPALDGGAGGKGEVRVPKKTQKRNWGVVVGSGDLVSRLRSTVLDIVALVIPVLRLLAKFS